MTEHTPNHIPASVRIWNTFISVFLLVYGTFGIYTDDLYIPGRRTSGVHFHGEPAFFVYAAMVCAILNLISVVVDHYDKRNNEKNYLLAANTAPWNSIVYYWVFIRAVIKRQHKMLTSRSRSFLAALHWTASIGACFAFYAPLVSAP
jgi:hypothetical protein